MKTVTTLFVIDSRDLLLPDSSDHPTLTVSNLIFFGFGFFTYPPSLLGLDKTEDSLLGSVEDLPEEQSGNDGKAFEFHEVEDGCGENGAELSSDLDSLIQPLGRQLHQLSDKVDALPRMPQECFIFSDKESLAVGTELLVLERVDFSASLGEIAILAGGVILRRLENGLKFLMSPGRSGAIARLRCLQQPVHPSGCVVNDDCMLLTMRHGACGDRLIVIGGPRTSGEGFIELNAWVPSQGSPQWNLLARKHRVVYNCVSWDAS
ncbi:hypothetical protein F3Y22_tig00110384pilonHSYRG00606 [Hibiscus syriacus]|uniref:Uncharacterized protein n=1 Tax=Hibiscus syriacus TaxID=106335 RepID=A0A6A3AX60_HIBSY|nr:hypothetical protein F3Y22_tig00110384pilonHSYRG00606 [Hibiscus syriacus]